MNQEKFNQFSKTYAEKLAEAVAKNPDEYALCEGQSPEDYARSTARRMMARFSENPGKVSVDGKGFENTCKVFGIKHTRKAIYEFLEVK